MQKGQPGTLEIGDLAPDVTFQTAGGSPVRLSELLADGPVFLAFFKVSCPTCQFTLPFLDRLQSQRLRVIAVSQDAPAVTERFASTFGVSLETVFDPASGSYPASQAFGLVFVPTMFAIESDGRIAWTWSGFHRKQLTVVAERYGQVLFQPDEFVPESKAG